jgi:glyoxylate/hydroxypyruvate reductase A
MAGALLFSSHLDDPVAWSAALSALMPELDIRVSPELGDPAEIETALVWRPPAGEMAALPNLKLIINLGAGVDPLLADPTIPPHIPVARLGDRFMAQMMTQFVTFSVLRHHRDIATYERQHRAGECRRHRGADLGRARVFGARLGALAARDRRGRML